VKFRTYKNTDLTVSEVGFGLWTILTGWWGNFTEGEAIVLMQGVRCRAIFFIHQIHSVALVTRDRRNVYVDL
jgi:aryl-alcohol dehydrogenase-like predicted oxidoreductase